MNSPIKALLVVLVALSVAITAYSVYYGSATAAAHAMLRKSDGEMEWLRHEFRLTEAQFQRIKARNAEYAPTCELMCNRIADANARLEHLIATSKTITPEIRAAIDETARVQVECRQAMLAHIYAVSAEMPPNQAGRYLEMMKSRFVAPVPRSAGFLSNHSK